MKNEQNYCYIIYLDTGTSKTIYLDDESDWGDIQPCLPDDCENWEDSIGWGNDVDGHMKIEKVVDASNPRKIWEGDLAVMDWYENIVSPLIELYTENEDIMKMKKLTKEESSIDKEFSYNGLTVTRYDYEALPDPMAAEEVDDDTMQKIVKEMYYMFLDNGWSDKDIQKYGSDIDKIYDEEPEGEMFQDEWWKNMEVAACKFGMRYYEDMNDNELIDESHNDIDNDPAYECPYCGGHNCEFDEADAWPEDGYFDGSDILSRFICHDCEKPYSVTFKLNVSDVSTGDPGHLHGRN